jgi:N-formylglutamate deformylase
MSSYSFISGDSPVLISMPHTGVDIPEYIAKTMTPQALKLVDTDWFIDRLYDFACSLGANVIKPRYSRYVIDLNRGIDGINLYPGANSTELCPTTTFDMSPIYNNGEVPSAKEVENRIKTYWLPYHERIRSALAELKEKHGYAILLDAHSILSHVPRFFEGQLPDFNFGTASGESCSSVLSDSIQTLEFSPYSMVCNARFKGGYITRAYGKPADDIHTIQLELSQHTYMNEGELSYNEKLADQVKPYLENIVKQLLTLNNGVLRT